MNTNVTPTNTDMQPIGLQPRPADGSEKPTIPVLPMALQDVELTDHDIETLQRLATDPNATQGRLQRVPKKIPLAEPKQQRSE